MIWTVFSGLELSLSHCNSYLLLMPEKTLKHLARHSVKFTFVARTWLKISPTALTIEYNGLAAGNYTTLALNKGLVTS